MSLQVDAAKARRDEALSTLYVTWPLTGEKVQRYSDDIHSEMQQAIIAEFHAEMAALVAQAQQARANAESILQRRTGSLSWLDDDQLIRANALAPFVMQDIKALGGDVDALAAFVTDALASDDRVLQWLILRHADQAFAGVDNDTLTPRNVMTWQQARDDLRQVVAPPELLDTERRAREILVKADDIQRAAAWELPETKANYAVKYGLPIDALPETLAVPD